MDHGLRSAPEPTLSREQKELRLRRLRLLGVTGLCLTIAAIGGGAFYYISSAPQRAASAFRAGMSMMTPGNYHLAIESFNRALEISPEIKEVYAQRGIAYQNMGEIDAAMEDFERALTVNPKDGAVLTARGMIFRSRKDPKRAIDEFSRVIDTLGDTDAYFERAQAYEMIGEHAKAVADLDKVVTHLQNAPHALRARALAKQRMGDEAGYKADIAAAEEQEDRNIKGAARNR